MGAEPADDQRGEHRGQHRQAHDRRQEPARTSPGAGQDDQLTVPLQAPEGEQDAEEERGRQRHAQKMRQQQQQHLADVGERPVRIGDQAEQLQHAFEQQDHEPDQGHDQRAGDDLAEQVAIDDGQHGSGYPPARRPGPAGPARVARTSAKLALGTVVSRG